MLKTIVIPLPTDNGSDTGRHTASVDSCDTLVAVIRDRVQSELSELRLARNARIAELVNQWRKPAVVSN